MLTMASPAIGVFRPEPPAPQAGAARLERTAFPPGTLSGLMELGLGLAGGLGLLALVDRCRSRRADQPGSASLAQEARSLRRLRIGFPAGMTMLETLRDQGYLETRLGSLGMEIRWIAYPSASSLLAALSDGLIDFCGGGCTPSVFAQAAGQTFVRVARERVPDIQGQTILVPEDSPIRNLRDLHGKHIAFDEGSSAHYVLIRALQMVGIGYNEIIPVLKPQQEALDLFRRGDVDAWVVWMPYAPTPDRRNYPGRSIADLPSILGEDGSQELPTLYYAVPELVRDYPRLLKALLEEVNEAGFWLNKLRLEEAHALARLGEIDPQDLALLQQRVLQRAILPLDESALGSLQRQANVLHDLGLIPTRVNVRDGTISLLMRQNWTY
ncbi:MAG: PhnD/SsuA/transferrin family substrate-binding protein [Cyanobium sp.]